MEEKILVTKSSMLSYEENIEAIKMLQDTYLLTNMGTYHKQLETVLREYLDVLEISLMVNGHMALEMAIQSFCVKYKGKWIDCWGVNTQLQVPIIK